MDNIGTKFYWSRETEVQRLVHTAKQVWSGFYLKKSFIVLPSLQAGNVASVHLPDLKYENIDFWEDKLKQTKLNFPVHINSKFRNEVFDLIKEKLSIDIKRLNSLEKSWNKIAPIFWDYMEDLLPNALKYINILEVRMTSFGTISSYQFLERKLGQKLIVYVRSDANISNVAEAIISGLLYTQIEGEGWSWEEVEAIGDYMLTKSKLASYFPEFKPTLVGLRSEKNEIMKLGKEFLKKLGVFGEKPMRTRYGEIYLNSEPISIKLSKSQKSILKEMIRSETGFITTNEIERILWGESEEKYSLWALDKAVQRLRKRLVFLGANQFVIKSVRGRGYCLNNV